MIWIPAQLLAWAIRELIRLEADPELIEKLEKVHNGSKPLQTRPPVDP